MKLLRKYLSSGRQIKGFQLQTADLKGPKFLYPNNCQQPNAMTPADIHMYTYIPASKWLVHPASLNKLYILLFTKGLSICQLRLAHVCTGSHEIHDMALYLKKLWPQTSQSDILPLYTDKSLVTSKLQQTHPSRPLLQRRLRDRGDQVRGKTWPPWQP